VTGRATIQGLVRVPLQALRFHPRNIRSNLGDLDELSASIRAEGVLVPLMAQRTSAGGLQLLHGHRRWAAADLAGLRTVPVVIIEQSLTDDEAILLMLAEDKKESVSLEDRRRAVAALRDEFGYDAAAIAERLGFVDAAALRDWTAGKGLGAAQAPRRQVRAVRRTGAPRKPRKHVPRIKPSQLHSVIAEWQDRAAPELLDQLCALLQGWSPSSPSTVRAPGRPTVDAAEVLQLAPAGIDDGDGDAISGRELQVVTGMANGLSNGEIGKALFLSEDTVKTYARRLFIRLGARDRAHAVRLAIEQGHLTFGPAPHDDRRSA